MFIYLNKRKAQSTLEYGLVIAIVVAALVAMQAYMKRGIQGKLKQSTDDIGEQFSPEHTTGTTTISSNTTSTETVTVADGQPTTATTSSQTQSHNTTQNVGALSQETW